MAEFKQSDRFVIHEPEMKVLDGSIQIVTKYSADDDLFFEESFSFAFPETEKIVDGDSLLSLTELLAISAATSYYKATLAKTIEVDFEITKEIEDWTNALFDQGLREFRFRNQLNLQGTTLSVDKLGKQTAAQGEVIHKQGRTLSETSLQKMLVPIGGGKDSATTLEILQRAGIEIIGFSVGEFEPIERCAKVAGIEMVHVARKIDPKLFELNSQGVPNGHIPVTAINSALACTAAKALGCSSVVMSNEASADEPTRTVDGIAVNHQWSKSSEAEKLFRGCLSSVSSSINYFSLLREMTEFQIFEMFSSFEKYHSEFTSCNRAFRIDENNRAKAWCLDCDKCRFVFLGLSAFRGMDYSAEIFGGNMFADETQVQGFLDLVGVSDSKPFECVGTVKESRTLARNCLIWDAAAISVVGKALASALDGLSLLPEKFPNVNSTSFVPETLSKEIQKIKIEQYRSHLSSHIEETAFALVGLGRDTSAIINFLESSGQKKNIEVFIPSNPDISTDEFDSLIESLGLGSSNFTFEAVGKSSELKAEVVFVSPGVSKYSEDVLEIKSRATGPLAWWLDYQKTHLPEKCFIGVTGTKGKSTTSSMLAHVLPNSIVAGNLGNAVGNIPLEDLLNADYVVLEISSYQSSYVTTPPDVVAITSFFDCHIDWHLTPENYRRDKFTIALRGPSEIIVSDTIDDFASYLISARKELGYREVLDEITLVSSVNKTLMERNREMVRDVVQIVCPDLTPEKIEERLSTFKELKHRQEIIAEKQGVIFVSDVLSTAPAASLASIDDFTLRYPNATIYLLCGGAYSNVDLTELAEGLNKKKDNVKTIALPETGHMIEDKLENFVHCDELADGVKYCAANAKPGDIVLLAPGAQSFHRYKNYEELAADFARMVDSLN